MSDFPPILTINQTCELLQLSRPKLYQWMYSGRIPFLKDGRFYRFSRDAVIEAIAHPVQVEELPKVVSIRRKKAAGR